MSKKVRDLKLKEVAKKDATVDDKIYSVKNPDISEKNVQDKSARKSGVKKRGKRRFYTGFAVVSIIFVLVGVLVAGAFVGWNMYLKEPTGLTLPQGLSLISDLYKDGSGIVTNPYDPEADKEAFYDNFKKSLYLAEDCDINVSDIVSGLLSNMLNGNQGEQSGEQTGELPGGRVLTYSDEQPPQVGDNGSQTGNPVLDDLLKQLKFDFSVLKGQSDDKLEGSMLELSDKQLAAVINEAFGVINEQEKVAAFEQEYGIVINEVLSVEQVIIDEATVLDQKDTRITVTVKFDLRDALKTALANNRDAIIAKLPSSLPDFVKSMVDIVPSLLPKTLYLTASVYPNQDTYSATLGINDMSQEKQDAVNRLLNRFMINYKSEKVSIPSMINQTVFDAVKSIQEIIPVSFASTGSVETKPIEAMIKKLGAENLTQGAFLSMIRDIKFVDDDLAATLATYTPEKQDQAAAEFIDGEFCTKYYFDNSPAEGSTENFITADNLFARVDGFMEDEEALSRITIKQDMSTDEYGDGGDYRPNAEYDAVSKLINGYIASSGTEVQGVDFWVMHTELKAKTADSETIRLVIEADLTKIIDEKVGDDEVIKSLVKQVVPEKIYIFVDYAQKYGAEQNIENTSVTIDVNGIGEAYSKKHFDTITTLINSVSKPQEGEEGFDLSYEKLESMLNEKISGAFRTVGNQLGRQLEFTDKYVILPNIYEAIAANDKLKYDPDKDTDVADEQEFNEKYGITAEDLFVILKQAYKYDKDHGNYVTNVTEENSSVDSFVKEIDTKYYLDTTDPSYDWSAKGLKDTLQKMGEDYKKLLRMTDETVEEGGSSVLKKGMATDETPIGSLKPFMDEFEFASVVNSSGSLDNIMEIMPKGVIEYINIYLDQKAGDTRKYAYIDMRINGVISLDNVSDPEMQQNKKYQALFPDAVEVIVRIRVNDDNDLVTYEADVNINEISQDKVNKTLFFVRRFSGSGNDLSKEGLEATIESKINGAINNMSAGGSVSVEFTEKTQQSDTVGGVEFDTIFALAVNNLYKEQPEDVKPTQEVMRRTIQHLYNGLGKDYALSNNAYVIEEDSQEGGNGDATAFTITPGAPSIEGNKISVNAQLTASFMDAYMGKSFDATKFADKIYGEGVDVEPGDIEYYQMYILPAQSAVAQGEESERAEQVKAVFGSLISPDQDYMVITLRVNTAKMSTDDTNKLIPKYVYVSALINIRSAAEGGSSAKVVFNNITDDEEKAVLDKLLQSVNYDMGANFNEQELEQNVMNTEIVNYTYSYSYNTGIPGSEPVLISYNIKLTVAQMLEQCEVRYCSYGDADRKPYIVEEAAKQFGAQADARYGLGYLYFDKEYQINYDLPIFP